MMRSLPSLMAGLPDHAATSDRRSPPAISAAKKGLEPPRPCWSPAALSRCFGLSVVRWHAPKGRASLIKSRPFRACHLARLRQLDVVSRRGRQPLTSSCHPSSFSLRLSSLPRDFLLKVRRSSACCCTMQRGRAPRFTKASRDTRRGTSALRVGAVLMQVVVQLARSMTRG